MSESPNNIMVGYIRSSTGKQQITPEMQRERIAAFAKAKDWPEDSTFLDEAKSGSRADNRPELAKALHRVCEIRGVLVSYKLDRWARSSSDAAMILRRLREAGAGLVSITESFDTTTSAGRMIYHILAAVAEFERDMIAERTASALSFLKSQNRIVGAVPYGYVRDGDLLLPCEDEQAVIRRIQSSRAAGCGYRAIARELNDAGVRTKSGGMWFPNSIKQTLERVSEVPCA